MQKIKDIVAFIQARPRMLYGAIAVVVIVVGYSFLGGNGEPVIKTETLRSGQFVQTISVSGKVTPSREVDLGFTTGGRIVQINGAVGSRVAMGSVIAATDSSDIRASIEQREAALQNQEAKLAAVREGARPEEIAVAQSSVDSAATALTRAHGAVIDSIRDAYIKSDDAVRAQVYQFVSNARSTSPQINFGSSDTQATTDVQAGIIGAEAMLSQWQQELLDLGEGSDIAAEAKKAQAHLTQVAALLARASTLLTSALPNPTETATKISGYTLDVASARTSVSLANSAISTSLTAHKNAASALDTAKKNLLLKQAGPVQTDIDAQEAQVRSAKADLANTRALLGKTLITAPFTGIITKMDAKVGLIAGSNNALVSMIGAGTFQIESYVPEVNIGLVSVDNPATVTLDAYGEEVPFEARVVSIDPAATVRDGVPTYRAILQFAAVDDRIKSGMTANVVITTALKEDVLSIPQGIIIERDGKKYVKIVDSEDTTAEREVKIGAISSLGRAEILSGLSDGDIIVLSEEL